MELMTPHGPAVAEVDEVPGTRRPRFLLVLTHGSGGGIDAPDLLAVRDAALKVGGGVARVVQPFRVMGRRAPGSAVKQDEAWIALIGRLLGELGGRYASGVPLVQGGRSNGARVTCRTARAVRAVAVVALAFPLHPPGRPERSRADELRDAGVDVLVVNGDRDPFGVPDGIDAARLVVLPGEGHDLKKAPARVGAVVAEWLVDRIGCGSGGVSATGSAVADRSPRIG